jgi:hypothetical protein
MSGYSVEGAEALKGVSVRFRTFIRVGVAMGMVVDLTLAIFALFFQSSMGPLFDIPLRSRNAATIIM